MQEFDFSQWRTEARELLKKGVTPENVYWQSEQNSLFQTEAFQLNPEQEVKVSREFLKLAEYVAAARFEEKWNLLYRILYRLHHENPHLLKVSVDKDVRKAQELAKSVSRDIHKMHAFVRFKKNQSAKGEESYVAWHKPEHLILRLSTPFFVRRFGDKPWSIFTPDGSAHWNLKELSFSEGIAQHQFEHEDAFDEVWKTYYKSIFNPARIKLKAMRAEMAPKYWQSMPETELIPELLREAPNRLQKMAEAPRFKAEVPADLNLPELKLAASQCRACPLFAQATQTVFGEGPIDAKLMIVGEQPGDQEDLAGKAFVGPAGEILEKALQLAKIDRQGVYVTNAVKHFKYTRQGKLRIHQKPSGTEMQACKPWLEAEIAKIKPQVIIALGATAGTAILGKLPKVQVDRGIPVHDNHFAPTVLVSWHPSAILRAHTETEKNKRLLELVADLKQAFYWSRAAKDSEKF